MNQLKKIGFIEKVINPVIFYFVMFIVSIGLFI